ncbi:MULTISPECIES: DNA cytosine methyltransferase [Agrobacterium]|uniref:DNA cytosine methyltransferase n=1 Tax=Agrobacterium tumefaciens TaxID=358 RepID=UPI001571EB99|nr:DNA cytosine methyltransferase [Agrobacterium tumefaciens]NSZ06320.1 DNA cytosine methyltransferase [Agrobacterium tumefaciens]
MDSKAQALADLKTRVISLQRQMTDRILKIAAEVEKLEALMPAKEARDFLRITCNLPTSELSTYVGFATKLKGKEAILETARASFPVVKALVAAEDDARAEILARMEIGARIDTQEITAIRKRLRLAKLTPFHPLMETNNRAVRAAARKRSNEASSDFQRNLVPLIQKLDDAKAADLPILAASKQVLRLASRLRDECLSIFGSEGVEAHPPCQGATQVVPVGYQALCRVAEGKYGDSDHYGADSGVLSSDFAMVTALRKMAGLPVPMGGREGRNRLLIEQPPRHVRLTALELCAGAGGMSIGLERAGFRHVGLFEFDKDAAATLSRNRPDWQVFTDDIRTVDFRPYRDQNIALVAGGLPCQPYSQEGKKLGKNDPRDLLPEAVRIVREVRPRAFLFENVIGLLHARHADHLADVLRGFRKAGYQTEIHRLEVSDFGIAQSRTRILIVGLKKEYAGAFRLPPAFPSRRANLGDSLVDLMSENGWTGAADWAREMREHPVLDRNGNVVAHGAQASTLVTSRGKRRKNAETKWDGLGFDMSKLSNDAPTNEDAAADGFKPELTMRMKARLQNFPDDWTFSGGKVAVSRQIGNAVPPRIGQVAGLALFGAMRNMLIDWEALLWPDEHKARVAVLAPSLDMVADCLQIQAPLAFECT